MNRRSFLKFAGLAPVVTSLVGELLTEPTQINTTGQPMFIALEGGKKGDVIECKLNENFARSGYLRIENDMPIEYRIITARKENVANRNR